MEDDSIEAVVWRLLQIVIVCSVLVSGGVLAAACAICVLTRVVREGIDKAKYQLTQRVLVEATDVPSSEGED